MIDPWPKLRLLIRAELLRARIAARLAAAKAWHFAAGLVLALSAVAMFTLAGFLWLSEHFGPVVAALVTGGVFGAGAVALIVLGHRLRAGPEAALAEELEDLARAGLAADLAEIEKRVGSVESSVRSFLDPGGGLASQLSVLLGIVTSFLSRARRR